ncbi:MAG TPA: serine hydrolase domain-containing protein [Thermoanaerobaculia bacterium]|nr:serine hydrolase domain-containing protein [Thermoanaerobaculia bacterium]
MTRALLALLLILGHVPVAAAARRRAVQHPPAATAPVAIVTAARQAAEAALMAGAPAVQIAMSHRGRILYSAAFGMSDRESATAATPRSVLQVGSITKPFTAAAILRLAERGALTLDDRIEKFVPEFNPRGATITLRHLLSHTSGVTGGPADQYSPLTREQSIQLINGQPLAFTPGSKYSYSNAGYRLLGYAIESITGRSFADFVQSELALPLGLLDTGVCGTSGLPRPDGYGVLQGKWTRIPAIDMSVPFAAGALCSTASDLARWSHLLATGRVMLPASYATMTTPARLTNNTLTPYGLGMFLGKMLGQPAASHTGAIAGFQSSLVYFSEQEIAVAVIVNASLGPAGVDAHLIALTVADAALATQYQVARLSP